MVGTVCNIKASTQLSVRKSPNASAAKVATVRLRDTVQVLGETRDQWCYIRVGDEYGYVKSQHLSLQEVWTTVENTAGAPTIDLTDPYMPILQQYYIALMERWKYTELHDANLCMMCDVHFDGDPHATIGYMLKDMNQDGTPELLIGS